MRNLLAFASGWLILLVMESYSVVICALVVAGFLRVFAGFCGFGDVIAGMRVYPNPHTCGLSMGTRKKSKPIPTSMIRETTRTKISC